MTERKTEQAGIDLDKLQSGDRRTLAKAITLIESSRADDNQRAQQLLQQILPKTGNSFRLGITGVPGVGKSTFIEAFGMHLLQQGLKVAVLAIDPSSPVAGGSILGDKTRMQQLALEPRAYIRPTPTSGVLGGVANKTRETLLLCEAAGFDWIIVETVGVGQSEYQVASMVDAFVMLMLPNSGDELQGIKKGILELTDLLLINKADGAALQQAQQTWQHCLAALRLMRHKPFWQTQPQMCSALEATGMAEVCSTLLNYQQKAQAADYWQSNRQQQRVDWFKSLISAMLQWQFDQNQQVATLMPKLEAEVVAANITPFNAAQQIIQCLK